MAPIQTTVRSTKLVMIRQESHGAASQINPCPLAASVASNARSCASAALDWSVLVVGVLSFAEQQVSYAGGIPGHAAMSWSAETEGYDSVVPGRLVFRHDPVNQS